MHAPDTLEVVVPVPRGAADELDLRSVGDSRLVVVRDGEVIAVRLRQCFPWSEPYRHLSLRDARDREIALVEDPSTLTPESRQALERALVIAGFVLEVTRVLSIDEEVEIRQWKVVTVQGSRSFQTHLDDWPRVLPGTGLLIHDVAGDLYRFANPAAMDRRSRELLWAFID